MKPNILYYSDCNFFAGCENMIANFLNDESIKNKFSVSFAYRYSGKYEKGLKVRVKQTDYQEYPLRLIKQITYRKPDTSSELYRIAHKIFYAFYIPINKYISIFINTFILFSFLRKRKIDIIHINNGGYPAASSCYSVIIASKLVGLDKIIYVVNNIAEDYRHPFRWLDYPLDFLVRKWVTVFITGSDYAGNRLKKVLKLPESKHRTINNGIERRKITLTKEEFFKKYSIPNNRYIVSVVANLEKRKGHIFLLKAIHKIKKQNPDRLNSFFIFEGVGPEKKCLERFIVSKDLSKDVLMIDYIPYIFNLLNASDFVILPSIAYEDFPNVVIEAMSLGKPVIGTEIAGMPEQIENNKTGFVVKPKSSDELVQAIVKLTSNPELIRQFSIEAKHKFENSYEKHISIKKYHNLYKSLI